MKAGRLLSLGIVCTLLATLSVAAGAAPLAGPCAPGAAYDPACDANQDGQITVTDIQLTAGHWNQTGTWLSDNSHNHLGQTWTGANNSLKLTGSYGEPDYAPLVLSNSAGLGLKVSSTSSAGVSVRSAGGAGVYVDSADYGGFVVNLTGDDGVYVGRAGDDGFFVNWAGNPSTWPSSPSHNGFEVAGAQGFGLYVGRADDDGVRIRSAASDGIELGWGGVYYPSYGLYVSSPGTPYNTLWPNTANAVGEWALYTVDNIEAGNVFMNAQTLVAVVGGDQPLSPGDVVTAIGLADPIPGSLNHLAQVRLGTADQANVVGVVSSRMALQPAPGKEGEQVMHSTDDPAQPGDYVAITVLGVAQVKVQEGAAIQPGQRLTVSATPGHAHALRTVLVEGVRVDESGPTLGVALEAAEDGMVWVLVSPQ